MNTENSKASKFEAFKGSEVKNPFQIYGGASQGTTWQDYNADGSKGKSGQDTWFHGPGETQNHPYWGEMSDMTFWGVEQQPSNQVQIALINLKIK
jgi:hypothetical protein